MQSKKGLPQKKSGVASFYAEGKGAYNREYAKEKYYIARAVFPKDYEEIIKSRAKSKGVTIAGYIKELVDRDLEINPVISDDNEE